MVAKRADIGDANGQVGAELLLDREIPLLNRRSFRRGLHALRCEDTASWRLHTFRNRHKRRQRARK